MKIRCIDGVSRCFKKDKVYEVKNGKIESEYGDEYKFTNIYCFNSEHASQFELVEEEKTIILDKEFIKKFKNENIVVNVETEQEWLEFTEKIKAFGINQDNIRNYYNNYTEKSCINVENNGKCMYCDIGYYKENGYTIIKYKDLEEEKKMFKIGDTVKIIKDDGNH